tara:strand:+ start:1398 stop:3023 length:1626 start_codon:yes stop_codon:yes gene_type:complete
VTSRKHRTADIIAKRLYEADVRFAFGIPGGEVLTIIDALENAGIKFLLSKHENAAGFMAEGVHHVTKAPGLMVATVGPGAANAVNVTVNALQDRVPLILITGCVDPAESVTYNHQVFDHCSVFSPITKASLRVSDGFVEELIDKAIAIATEGRPGPVHLDLPIKIANQLHPVTKIPTRATPAPIKPANGESLNKARKWLLEAQNPVMIVGLDAVHQNASSPIIDFCKKFGVPVVTTYKAKGIIPDDDELSLGAAGLSPLGDKNIRPVIHAADLILLLGYDPIEMRSGWRDLWDSSKTRVVEFLIEPEYSYMHKSSLQFVCDISEGIEALSKDLKKKTTWKNGELMEMRTKHEKIYGQKQEWGPGAITETVRRLVPRDTVITMDSGAHRILISQAWRTYVPRSALQSSAFCTMGCALPLATGAKLADPGRVVVAFMGDGGLEMVLGELITLRDLGLPVIVIVFVDASLALIEKKQREMQYKNVGVDMDETDFKSIALATGGKGFVVQTRTQLEDAVNAALSTSDTFTLIACRIPRGSYDEII